MSIGTRTAVARLMTMNRPGVVIAIIAAAWTAPTQACSLCHSRLAEDVRAAVLGPDFWPTLAALLLPFPVLVAAVLLVRRATP